MNAVQVTDTHASWNVTADLLVNGRNNLYGASILSHRMPFALATILVFSIFTV